MSSILGFLFGIWRKLGSAQGSGLNVASQHLDFEPLISRKNQVLADGQWHKGGTQSLQVNFSTSNMIPRLKKKSHFHPLPLESVCLLLDPALSKNRFPFKKLISSILNLH